VAIKGLDPREDLAVVPARDQHLCARADCRLEDRERAGGELVLLDLGDLVLTRQLSACAWTWRRARVRTSIRTVA
jgi:hypothetical protein